MKAVGRGARALLGSSKSGSCCGRLPRVPLPNASIAHGQRRGFGVSRVALSRADEPSAAVEEDNKNQNQDNAAASTGSEGKGKPASAGVTAPVEDGTNT